MDKKIEKKGIPLRRLIPILVIILVIGFLAYQVITRSGKTRLKVDDPSRMTIAPVHYGEFQEYYPFDGVVVPVTSVYLDAEQGGRVDEIFVEGGKPIKKGDLILRFSNTGFQTTLISTESSLLDNMDRYQNTQLTLAKNKLALKESLLNMNYDIRKLEKQYNRYKALKKDGIVISEEQFENVKDQLDYTRDKKILLEERIRQEDILSEKQLEQADKAIKRINLSLDLLSKQIDSLEVRAPISGHLSSINAEIGQKINPGQRIGQIDVLDKLKIQAGIDQYYNSKVTVGTKGKFSLDGEKYEVEVIKIYPEVLNNQFNVDMAFIGDPPTGIKRGQTLTTELSFSEPGQSLMVKKGGFYQQTSGRWVYLISKDGKTAHRVDMRLGRQNPRSVEILEGLHEGDWIITSGYDTFKEADELIFGEPLKLKE